MAKPECHGEFFDHRCGTIFHFASTPAAGAGSDENKKFTIYFARFD